MRCTQDVGGIQNNKIDTLQTESESHNILKTSFDLFCNLQVQIGHCLMRLFCSRRERVNLICSSISNCTALAEANGNSLKKEKNMSII